jgi:NAD(P)-dependent dehydrogenase (short-subunit alcohol dehydrogenase family)
MGRLDGKVAIVTGAHHDHRLIFPANTTLRRRLRVWGRHLQSLRRRRCQSARWRHQPSRWRGHRSHQPIISRLSACIEKFGRCDILVNNAGWSYTNKPTTDVTEEEFERTFDINVKGVYLGCNAWTQQAIDRKEGGVIINIASVGATRPRPGLVWYNASKGAVWNATKGLAAEYGPHQIRVVSICPLVTGTGLFSAFTGMEDTPENRTKFTSNVPMGRIGEVDDVTAACVFMASSEAKFITGVNLEVDGGRCI